MNAAPHLPRPAIANFNTDLNALPSDRSNISRRIRPMQQASRVWLVLGLLS